MPSHSYIGDFTFGLSHHAQKRRAQRGFQNQHIAHLLRYGRKRHQNNAVYYSIGNKEIKRHIKHCLALKEMNGMHLVTAPNGSIITVFRNRNFSLLKND